MIMLIGFAAVAFLAMVWNMVLLVKLRPFRTDLAPGQHFGEGASQVWQVNVLRRKNYTPEGRHLLRWVIFAQAIWFVAAVAALLSWASL
jgi:hypothetical protein